MHQAIGPASIWREFIPVGWSARCRKNRRRCSGWSRRRLAEAVRHRVQAGLLLDSRDLQSERPAAAEVASWVMALWTERLVGGEAERADDSPALAVLVRLYAPRWLSPVPDGGALQARLWLVSPDDRHGAADEQARYDWLAARLADAGDDAACAGEA